MIVHNAPQVEDRPARSADLPKGETRRDNSMSEKELTGKPFTRELGSETWVIWVKLYCLKSSGKLE